ncbi:MAG: FAD-dependent oxidoreductase [Methylocystis sp.]
MNVASERSRSYWTDQPVIEGASALLDDQRADVVVIGSGIAGMSVAYELASAGKKVVVLDRGPIGKGMTARTTAHLASASDDGFDELIRLRGEEIASAWRESQQAAIDRIESLQRTLNFDCDFQRVDGYLFAATEEDAASLEREFIATKKAGLPIIKQMGAPFVGREYAPALRYPNQARVHPLKYLQGLARAIAKAGGDFYANTTAVDVLEEDGGVRVATSDGRAVRADYAVVATNAPISDRFAIHTKQAPYRTYAMAFELPPGALPDALYWDTLDPYHYVRLQPGVDGLDILIVGGEDHRSGEANDADRRFAALEDWMRRLLPPLGKELRRWSGQVLEPVDGVAFIGRDPGSERLFVATGDSGQGMTHGALAGLIIKDLILTGANRWAETYDPARKPISAIGEYLSENLAAPKNFAEYVTPGEIDSWDRLKPGEGAIVRSGLSKVAACRGEDGKLFLRSAVCSHLGCLVHWNAFERCWDCPCHGSQFAPDGEALNGPAFTPLQEYKP